MEVPSDAVVDQEEKIHALAIGALRDLVPLVENDDVAVTIRHLVRTEEVEVIVEPAGKPGKVDGKTGRKRDLANLADTILDALQGAAYSNDRQVARLTMERVLD